MTPTPSQEPVASEREQFEAWVYPRSVYRDQEGQYKHDRTEWEWDAWQAALSAPPAQAPHASNPQILKAYKLGFLRAAEWVNRDDLRADLDSDAYAKDRARDLGPMLDAPPTAQAVPVAASEPSEQKHLRLFNLRLSAYGVAMLFRQSEKCRVLSEVLGSMFETALSAQAAPVAAIEPSAVKKAISNAIGFEWLEGELQTVNASDLLRIAAALAAALPVEPKGEVA
jgi:hypothetical protein